MPKSPQAPTSKAGSTPEQLINAVLELIMEEGADAVTVGGVAERADVALRTVYNHFPSREAMLEAALDRIVGDIEKALTTAEADDAAADERLRRFVTVAFAEFDRLGALLTKILSIRGVPQLEARLADVSRWRRTQVEEILAAAGTEGRARLRPDDATVLAEALIGHGSWEVLVQGAGLSGRRAGALLGDALVNTLLSPAQPTGRSSK